MKTYGFYFAVVLFVVVSCLQPDVKTDGALRTVSSSGPLPLGGHAHQFQLDSSVKLISNLAGASRLTQLTAGYGWGGSFPVSAFRVLPSNQGVLLWYCFRGGNNPQLFLALEHLQDYDPANLPVRPISSALIGPTSVFRNTFEGVPDENRIREFLRTQSGDQSGWVSFADDEVNGYIDSADSLFREFTDGNGERYNHYLFGFFSVRHEAGFNTFLDQAGENGFIRYYFGYEEKDRPNRIRIILVAVDPKGEHQGSKTNEHEGGHMQKSWPPPPDN